ncbi:MAG: ribonuclease J [Patescibacteria group bacterium]
MAEQSRKAGRSSDASRFETHRSGSGPRRSFSVSHHQQTGSGKGGGVSARTPFHAIGEQSYVRPGDNRFNFPMGRAANGAQTRSLSSSSSFYSREIRSNAGAGFPGAGGIKPVRSNFRAEGKSTRPNSGHSGRHYDNTRRAVAESREMRHHVVEQKMNIPPLAEGDVRVIVFGGVEEVGRNMSAIEFGNDIIVVDCGFMFKDEDTPGIDYILPNTQYLEERKDRIRGVFITHGHLDHIGGLPYILPRIGNPPVYARNLTALLIQKRQDEFPDLPPIDIKIVETEDRISFTDTAVRFFKVTHTIPDSMGVIVETPHGIIVNAGDLKLTHKNGVPTEEEEAVYAKFKKEKVLLLLSDSTNCQKPGFSIPEPEVHVTIEKLIKEATGRVIVATFASLLERVIKIVEFCDTHGKKLVVDGRSMKSNIELAQKAGLFQYKKGTLIGIEEMDNYPPDRIVMIVTGAQGDQFAVLMRTAMKKHKYIKLRDTDTILFSSSVVPGNERAVQKLKDLLSRQGAKIVHYETSDVHSSGHAYHDETRWIISHINPKFFIPLHGYHYMLRSHTEIAQSTGIPKENTVIADDGSIIEIREQCEKIVKLSVTAPNEMIMVDGFVIGNLQEVVMRDRQMLAEDGIVVIVATVDMHSGKLMKSPDIVARGFVYVRESQELLNQARLIIKKTVEDACCKGMKGVNFEYVKEDVRDQVGKFLFQQTQKQPMVIPVLLGI